MGLFDAFRIHGGPTLYPSYKTAVTEDVTEWGFAFAIIIIIVSFLIILPGFRGRERWYFFIRAVVGCFILVSIMICNFGQEWEKAEVRKIRTFYKAGISHEIENATVTVKIGLRSVNITLKTDPVSYHVSNKVVEEIDYNERFHWNDFGWTQGRGGFGPLATLVNREYRDAQLKGSPFPILWIAEYFTIDGEGIRWGRFYRQAGYFTHCLLWLALPLWVITIMLFKIVLEFGAYFSMATGATLLLGNVIYATVRNPLELAIHIGDGELIFSWGWTFWLNLVNGLLALFIGIVVWFMNLRFTEAVFTFFGVDILTDIEEYYASIDELRQMGIHIAKPVSPSKGRANSGFDTDPGDVVINAQEKDVELYDNVEGITRGFRRKNQGTFAKRFDRSMKVKSRKAESRVEFKTGSSNGSDAQVFT